MFRFAMTMSLALTAALLTGACTKGAKTENNTNTSQANRLAQSPTSILVQPTLKGDIERISLYISMARDAAKNNNWQEAVAQLQGANKEVDSALGRKLRMREEFEALKSAIDRAIGAVERREKDADSQLAELQVRIGAIKTMTP
jgi:CRISPR/Cas system CSM-associated protein Csm2 small subunit